MQFIYATLLLQSLAFGSQDIENLNTAAIRCNSQNNGYVIGMSVDAIEAVIERDNLPRDYKVCPKDSSKCGADGVFFNCINDKWVENRCKCPKMQCRKTGMFNDCINISKRA